MNRIPPPPPPPRKSPDQIRLEQERAELDKRIELRDHLAEVTLREILKAEPSALFNGSARFIHNLGARCYEVADAMLLARDQGKA